MFERSVLLCICGLLYLGDCKLSRQEQLNAEKQCVDQVQIDYNIVLDVARTLKVPDDAKYKQFLDCYYKKQGITNAVGEIEFGEIKEVLTQGEDGYSEIVADTILLPCKTIRTPDPADLSHLVLQCIFKNLPELN